MKRTTLTLDDDIFMIAKTIANEKATSIGKVISNLARKGLRKKITYKEKNGFPVFQVSQNSKPITLDDIKKMEDEVY